MTPIGFLHRILSQSPQVAWRSKFIFESHQEQAVFKKFLLSGTPASVFISFPAILPSWALGNKPSLCHVRERHDILPGTNDPPV